MTDERSRYIEGLRVLANVLENHPGIPLPLHGSAEYSPMIIGFYSDRAREDLGAAARVFPCTWAKDADGTWFNLDGALGGGLHVQLYAAREQVCTRRVTGVQDQEVEEVVTPAVTRKVTKPVEVVEWDCGPLLAPRETLPDYQEPPGIDTGSTIAVADPGEPGVNQAALPRDVVPGDLDAIPANRIGDPEATS